MPTPEERSPLAIAVNAELAFGWLPHECAGHRGMTLARLAVELQAEGETGLGDAMWADMRRRDTRRSRS